MNLVTNQPSTPTTPALSYDPHAQLRALYIALLEHQDYFDEFKHLLSMYGASSDPSEQEPAESSRVRAALNNKIRSWVGGPFADLSVVQVLQWRAIIVEERLNVSIAPWKESSGY